MGLATSTKKEGAVFRTARCNCPHDVPPAAVSFAVGPVPPNPYPAMLPLSNPETRTQRDVFNTPRHHDPHLVGSRISEFRDRVGFQWQDRCQTPRETILSKPPRSLCVHSSYRKWYLRGSSLGTQSKGRAVNSAYTCRHGLECENTPKFGIWFEFRRIREWKRRLHHTP